MGQRSDDEQLPNAQPAPHKPIDAENASESPSDAPPISDAELSYAAVDALNARYRPRGPVRVRSSL